MATLKTGKWSPDETHQVIGIPKDQNTRKILTKLSAKLKRPYANVYAKWNDEHKKSLVNTPAPTNNDIPAMALKFEADYVGSNSRIDEVEILSLNKSLAVQLPRLEPFKGAVVIPARMERATKEFFKQYAPKVFSVQAIQGNTKEKRVIRKL